MSTISGNDITERARARILKKLGIPDVKLQINQVSKDMEKPSCIGHQIKFDSHHPPSSNPHKEKKFSHERRLKKIMLLENKPQEIKPILKDHSNSSKSNLN